MRAVKSWLGRRVNDFRRIMGPLWAPITHVETEEPLVALTFDDGPHPKWTPELLDVLGRHDARGTFFMLGKSAARQPALVERVAAEGHAVGNHSWDHPAFYYLDYDERRTQIRTCEKILAPHGEKLFRPPYGSQNMMLRLEASWLGYEVVGWTSSGGDWKEHDAETVVARLKETIEPGSIIVLHDALYTFKKSEYRTRGMMVQAIDRILENLGQKYEFVTVPELFRRGTPRRRYWGVHAEPELLNQLYTEAGAAQRYTEKQIIEDRSYLPPRDRTRGERVDAHSAT